VNIQSSEAVKYSVRRGGTSDEQKPARAIGDFCNEDPHAMQLGARNDDAIPQPPKGDYSGMPAKSVMAASSSSALAGQQSTLR
jgi:hypothetical protein